jgi:hypothetical protein
MTIMRMPSIYEMKMEPLNGDRRMNSVRGRLRSFVSSRIIAFALTTALTASASAQPSDALNEVWLECNVPSRTGIGVPVGTLIYVITTENASFRKYSENALEPVWCDGEVVTLGATRISAECTLPASGGSNRFYTEINRTTLKIHHIWIQLNNAGNVMNSGDSQGTCKRTLPQHVARRQF